jgi:hypothetical protein
MKWLDCAETAVFEVCRALPEGSVKWAWESPEGIAARALIIRGILRVDRQTSEFTYLRPTPVALLIRGALANAR